MREVILVRRSPTGQLVPLDKGKPMPEDKAQALLRAGHCDELWPIGLNETLKVFGPRLVLLYAHDTPVSTVVKSPGKQPIHQDWPHREVKPREAIAHVLRGGNLGVRAGDGLVILDFDDEKAEAKLMEKLGRLTPTVETGSGKHHYYLKASQEDIDCLPAKIRWRGEIVGEIQRTRSQQVVCPPSIHPRTRDSYRWLTAADVLQPLPEKWLAYLVSEESTRTPRPDPSVAPEWVKLGDTRGHEADGSDWTGPDADEIVRRALLQPGARSRAGGVKFQCPGCRAEGHDKHKDNAIVGHDGRWGCALDDDHKRDIAEALGIRRELPLQASEEREDQLIEPDMVDQTEEPPMADQE